MLLRSILLLTSSVVATVATADTTKDSFESCKVSLQQQAIDQGIEPTLAKQTFAAIQYQNRVIELDRSQPEFVQTFPGYFSKRVNTWRIDQGRAMAAKHKELLAKLYQQYGVPAHYLLAFWGLETNFGNYKGKMPVLDSLTTLACDERRSRFFTKELMIALSLLQEQSLDQKAMVGSWAGAMGHTQFMPSAYANYAVDGDGDGQINLWDSEIDALTSAANFLANLGWQGGFRWGREVMLPNDFNYQLAGYKNRQSVTQWQEMGITKSNGEPLGKSELGAYVVIPSGHNGPAFLAYPNFRVIMRWNNSEFYAIAVGHLADRIAGLAPLSTPLPTLPVYSRQDIMDLQHALNLKGLDVGKPDGIIGPATRAGIRQLQTQLNMVADGFPSLAVMQAVGVKKATDTPS